MLRYILNRVLYIIPTLFLIFTINFFIIQLCPGGPVEQLMAKITGESTSISQRLDGESMGDSVNPSNAKNYFVKQSVDPKVIAKIQAYYGFDKPIHVRFWETLKKYAVFDFGNSFSRDIPVLTLMAEKFPVSITLGFWTTLLSYLIAIPLGIKKAVNAGSRFDKASSFCVAICNALPTFIIAIVLIIFFAGGRFWTFFPLRGLASAGMDSEPFYLRVLDYLHHIILPIFAMLLGSLSGLIMWTRNSFLEEIRKQYVVALRAKGLSENKILYGHVFRNAMLVFLTSFPAIFIGILFTGTLFIEVIFSLDGLGLLGFEAALQRDFPVMFATLYISTLLGLIMKLLSDLMSVFVDPRIDFTSQ